MNTFLLFSSNSFSFEKFCQHHFIAELFKSIEKNEPFVFGTKLQKVLDLLVFLSSPLSLLSMNLITTRHCVKLPLDKLKYINNNNTSTILNSLFQFSHIPFSSQHDISLFFNSSSSIHPISTKCWALS